jgi:hypothetical protein
MQSTNRKGIDIVESHQDDLFFARRRFFHEFAPESGEGPVFRKRFIKTETS